MSEKENVDWYIYEGNGTTTLESIKDKKPKWRNKKLPKHNAQTFIANEKIKEAVNTAIYLRRPLLVTGDPGIGKSTLAKAISENLELGEVLKWNITSRSVLKDALYFYDALARLHNIQMLKLLGEQDCRLDENKNLSVEIKDYLKLGVLGTAFLSKEKRVVLIDELDKCDRDLPNDLLHVFEEQEFEIPELKRLKLQGTIDIEDSEGREYPISNGHVEVQEDFPIIIMTSNGEQEFPSAFLRRCICVEFTLPKNPEEQIEQLIEMVKAHFKEHKDDERIEAVVEEFVELKEDGLRSNDQLLNAMYLVLESDNISFDDFKDTVLQAIG
jgi:MoxR-like ATPase